LNGAALELKKDSSERDKYQPYQTVFFAVFEAIDKHKYNEAYFYEVHKKQKYLPDIRIAYRRKRTRYERFFGFTDVGV